MNLDYDPGLGRQSLRALEREARRCGLALDQLELLGQDAKVTRDFLRAAARGRAATYLERVDWRALELAMARRRRPAPAPSAFAGLA